MYRRGHIWTADKLDFLEKYIPQFKLATRKAYTTHYVDGFAGPGINDINDTKRNGSPLIALNVQPPFTKYFLIEKDRQTFEALNDNVSKHPNHQRIKLFNQDFNEIAPTILSQIPDKSPTFFFLDPEGLELDWQTVELISHRTKADLFILISSSGVNRNVINEAMHEKITRFYGSDQWKQVLSEYFEKSYPAGTTRFEVFTDLYVKRLNELGFTNAQQFLIARNNKNVPIHALVFAIKSDKGEGVALRIAESVLRNLQSGDQRRLF